MHNVVLEITNKYISRLPEQEQYLSPEDLTRYGIPDFVVEKVRLELQRNLFEAVSIPETDWANMTDEAVVSQWNSFLKSIADNVRLPMSYASSVFESSIDDIISVLAEPRIYISELIFGDRKDLFRQEYEERSQSIVIFRHLPQAVLRFMYKKEIDIMTKERANQIIARIDDRLTEHFSPLNWAQHLDPLFILTDNKVDPDLLRCFFEDKGKPLWAKRFDRAKDSITRSEFIEILSEPEVETYSIRDEEEKDELPVSEEKQKPALIDSFNKGQETDTEPSLSDKFKNSENGSLADQFVREDTDIQKKAEAEIKETKQESTDLNSKLGELSAERFFAPEDEEEVSEDNDAGESESVEEQDDSDRDTEKKEIDDEEAEQDENDTSIPIWKRFADAQSEDENLLKKYNRPQGESEENHSEKSLADQFAETGEHDNGEEKPIMDLAEGREKETEVDSFEVLYHYVEDQENRFTDELFGGDSNSFVEAIRSIADFGTWSEASKYISSEIFRRNMINIYSESAIDFTDRLQTYFIEKK